MNSTDQVKPVIIISSASIFVALVVIIGWEFNIPVLETVLSDYISMKFNTALCFIFISVALILAQLENKQMSEAFFLPLSFLCFLLGLVTLCEYAFHFNAGIDELFVSDKVSPAHKYPFPGRMAVTSASCFVLFGLSFISLKINVRFLQVLAQYALHVVTVASVVSIIGYLYGLSSFYSLSSVVSMALNTGVLFFFLSVAASLLRPEVGVAALFTGKLVGNKMAGRLMIMILLMLTFIGILRQQSQHYQILTFELSISMAALSFLIVGVVILWHTALWLNKIDLSRYEAEEEVKVMNERLKQRVEERSAELRDLFEKFRENEAKFKTAFEYSAIGMALVSTDLRWLKVNKQLCDLFGYSEQEMLSLNIIDVTHPEDREISSRVVDNSLVIQSEITRVEKRYITKNGSVAWVSVNFSLVKDSSGAPAYFVSQYVDITARKQSEEAQKLLIENEEKLRALFDNVEGSTSLIDPNFRLIVFNSVFRKLAIRLTGKEPTAGDLVYESLSPDDRNQRFDVLRRVLLGNKETIQSEYDLDRGRLYLSTSLNPVIVDGKVTAISAYTVDLTSWREAENKVRKADARFKAIVEGVFVGIKLVNIKGEIIYRSPSMEEITGWGNEEMKHPFLQLTHPDDLEMVEEAYREVSGSPGKFVNIINRVLHKQGYYIWIESQVCNRLSDPYLEAIIVVVRDITERKVVEDQLVKSEAKYHSLIEHASDAIYLLDFEGNILEVNESMCKMTGYTKPELLQLNYSDLIDPEQLKVDPVNFTQFSSADGVIRERRLLRKDGLIHEIEVSGKSLEDGKILVIARDIASRKQMEAELRNTELKFRTLAEKSMVGVYISQNERFIYVNPRLAEIFGYAPDELIDTDRGVMELLYSEEDIPKIRENNRAKITGAAESVNYEVTGIKKDGTLNRVEFYGSMIVLDGVPTFIGTMLDVTERSKAAEILKRSEANLKAIMETTDVAYVLMDRNLSVMEYNQQAIKFLNNQFNSLPVKGNVLSDLIPKERYLTFGENAQKALNGNNVSYEVNFGQPDGDENWFYIRLYAIIKDKNEILGLMLSITDITERKNIEENLRKAYRQIQNNMERIKDMAWKQSHEIRAPVANLKGLAEMLQKDPYDEQAFGYVLVELEKLDNLIKEMATEASEG